MKQRITILWNSFFALYSCCFFICLFPLCLMAQPDNDDCSGAHELTVGTAICNNTTGTNQDATDSGEPNPGCGSYNGGDIWYFITAPSSGSIIIETSWAGGFNDSGIAAYSGDCSSLVLIECDDNDGLSLYSKIILTGRTPGETLYIRVWEKGNNSFGEINICVFEPPVNDLCSGAIDLVVGTNSLTCTQVSGTNNGASDSGVPHPQCSNYQGGDVWYKVTVPSSGRVAIETSSAGGISDVDLAVYEGNCNTLTKIGCDQSGGDDQFAKINIAYRTPNEVLYVRVWEYGNNASGEFNICAYEFPEPPVNDICSGAVALNVGTNGSCDQLTQGNFFLTDSGEPDSQCGSYTYLGGDLWYSIIVPSSGNVTVEVYASIILTAVVNVYSGNCSDLTKIGCAKQSVYNDPATVDLTLQNPGETLYIQVYELGNNGFDSFGTCAYEPANPPPNNDICIGAELLTLGEDRTCNNSFGNNQYATDSGVSNPGCAEYSGGDVWYKMVVPPSGKVIIETKIHGGDITDTGMAVYDGTCSNPALIECNDDGGGNDFSKITLFNRTPQETLYIRIWENGNDASGSFIICAYKDNDLCLDAIELTVDAEVPTLGSNINTSDSGVPDPGCGDYQGGDIWFKVVVPNSGNVAIETEYASGLSDPLNNVNLAVYSGVCSNLTLLACDEFSGENLFSKIELYGRSAEETLLIRVWEYGNDQVGTFLISAYESDPSPQNDDVCNAIDLTAFITSFPDPQAPQTFSNSFAGVQSSEPSPLIDNSCMNANSWCDAPDNTVWFTFTAPAGGDIVSVYATFGSSEAQLAAWEADNCSDVTNGNAVMVAADALGVFSIECLIPGKTYFIQVDGFEGDMGDFTISIEKDNSFPCTVFNYNGAADLDCGAITIDGPVSTGTGEWMHFFYAPPPPATPSISIIASLNDKGNVLGNVSLDMMINGSTDGVRQQSNGTHYLDRNWSISVDNQPTSDICIRLYFTDDELATLAAASGIGNDVNNLVITKIDDGNCGDFTVTGSSILTQHPFTGTSEINGAHCVQFETSGFSSFFAHSASTPLPVELLSFTGIASSEGTILQWTTATEESTEWHIPERSPNGRSWREVDRLPAAGNSLKEISYKTKDRNPFPQTYYRLKTQDVDGTLHYSRMIVVDRKNKLDLTDIHISPNPGKNKIYVDILPQVQQAGKLSVYNPLGQKMKEEIFKNSPGRLELSLNNYNNGIYLLIFEQNGQKVSRKFIVNK